MNASTEPHNAMMASVDAYRREANFARSLRGGAPVSWTLVAVNVACHLAVLGLTAVNGETLATLTLPAEQGAMSLNLMLGAKINALVLQGQWWRLVTAMFLHGGWLHLMFNVYGIYIIGPLLERLYGSRRLLIIYVFAGLFGGLGSLLLTDGPSVGASGAVYGLLGALFVFGLKFRGRIPPSVSRAFGARLLPIVVISLAIGFLPGLNMDNGAHFGGLAGGALVAAAMKSNLCAAPGRWRSALLELGLVASLLATAFGAVFGLWQVMACGGSAERFQACHPSLFVP